MYSTVKTPNETSTAIAAIEGEKLYSSVFIISTGNVVIPIGRINAVIMTSPKEEINASSALVIIPDRMFGILISNSVCHGFAPITIEASSMDTSKLLNVAQTVLTTYGRTMTVCTIIRSV